MQRHDIAHKASFQVSRFLNSKQSLPYKLNGNARSLLRYLGDCMDMKKSYECTVSCRQMATYSGCSMRTVTSLIKQLSDYKLIKITISRRGKLSTISLGSILTYATIA